MNQQPDENDRLSDLIDAVSNLKDVERTLLVSYRSGHDLSHTILHQLANDIASIRGTIETFVGQAQNASGRSKSDFPRNVM